MSDPVQMTPDLLAGILEQTLPALVEDLRASEWYVSEHAVVNLFVFAHLVPAFQELGLDLTLMGIEASVLQVEKEMPTKLSARKDLVIWHAPRTTRWKGCQISRPVDREHHRKYGCKPLAVIEWKNISRITARPNDVESDHVADLEWLRANLSMGMIGVGYAILVDQRQERAPRLTCRRVTKDGEPQDFVVLPKATAAAIM